MITIAKASAGSGKTYTLARTYISLLLQAYEQDPWPYRHILAVTFTNKATGEMKARILKELDILAHDPASSDYFHDFVPAICSSDLAMVSLSRLPAKGGFARQSV